MCEILVHISNLLLVVVPLLFHNVIEWSHVLLQLYHGEILLLYTPPPSMRGPTKDQVPFRLFVNVKLQ